MPRIEIIDEMNQVFMENNCEKIRELISPYIDGEVTSEERELVDSHISECAECKTEHDKMKKTVEMLNFSALSPEEDLEKAVLTSIRSNARRNRFIRLGSTIAACFVLVVCVCAFGVLEMMQKSHDTAMEDSADFEVYDASEKTDNAKGNTSSSRTVESDIVAEGEGAEMNFDDYSYSLDLYAGERIKSYKQKFAPDFEGIVNCVVVTRNNIDESLNAVLLFTSSDYDVYSLEFTKDTFGLTTTDLADDDVIELLPDIEQNGESFILYVKLK
jgi:hypothetical protein